MIEKDKNIQRQSKTVVMIDERTIIRESMLNVLKQQSNGLDFQSFSTINEVIGQGSKVAAKNSMCLLNIGSEQLTESMLESYIQRLRSAFPKMPIIILADNEELLNLRVFLNLELDGFITTNISIDELSAALSLVLVGGRYIPESLILMLKNDEPNAYEYKIKLKNTQEIESLKFTPRQLEVLEMLYHGESNKVIAYQLKICESTVKVHVREIMKKLSVTNRAQVAYIVSRFFEENS